NCIREPSKDVMAVRDAVKSIDLTATGTQLLAWLAVSSWMDQWINGVDNLSGTWHEQFLNSYCAFGEDRKAASFLEVKQKGTDGLFAMTNWLQRLCLRRVGTAWFTYCLAIDQIVGDGGHASFAYRLGLTQWKQ